MNRDELKAAIESKLRGLRSCDTQATAVAWMSAAYKLMDECLLHLADLPPPDVRVEEKIVERVIAREKLFFVPARPAVAIAQAVADSDVRAWEARRAELQRRSINQTVIYPEVFLHPGLRREPKAWTHKDTLRLERAVKTAPARVQRRGR